MDKPTYKFKDIDIFKRSPEIEAGGVEFEFSGGRILTCAAASENNPVWQTHSEAIYNEWNRLRNAKADPKRVRVFMARSFARYCVRDWKGWMAEGDVEIPFSHEACEAMLIEADDVYDYLMENLFKTQNFRAERVKQATEAGKESSTGA